MLSKCANPDCSAQFQYLSQGKLFQLSPTPEVDAITGGIWEHFYERFWLCEKCCKEMKVIWDGTRAVVVPLPSPSADPSDDQRATNKDLEVLPGLSLEKSDEGG
jgi:hypothetical protein